MPAVTAEADVDVEVEEFVAMCSKRELEQLRKALGGPSAEVEAMRDCLAGLCCLGRSLELQEVVAGLHPRQRKIFMDELKR